MQPNALAGIKILVVDDDADLLYLVRRILTNARAEVCVATNVEGALRNIALLRPDILISDIDMPACDGYELIRHVRRLAPEDGGTIPALALTAHVRDLDKTKARDAGFTGHLGKPMRALRLIEAIRTTLAGRQLMARAG